MSMTKRFAVSFDLKVIIAETDIQEFIRTVSDFNTPLGTKNPNALELISSLRHSETEEDTRIYVERLIEIKWSEMLRKGLKEHITDVLDDTMTMSPPKVSVIR